MHPQQLLCAYANDMTANYVSRSILRAGTSNGLISQPASGERVRNAGQPSLSALHLANADHSHF